MGDIKNVDAPVKIGMVGAGFMGQLAHLANYVEIDDCQIVALAELRPELRRQVCQRYGIPKSYASHEELLEDREVEAVVAVTPRYMTGPVALDCLKAGKHLLTEKPMAGTVEQGERLVRTAREQEIRYAVGYVKRYDKGIQMAKQILDDLLSTGELGPVTFVRAHNFMGDSYCNIAGHIETDEKIPANRPGWSENPDWIPEQLKRPYVRFLNVHIHNINLLRYFFNQTPAVNYVRLDRLNGQVAVLDFGSFTCVLEAGCMAHRGWDDSIEIYFASGRLRIEYPPGLLRNVPARIELYKGGNVNETYVPHVEWEWAFRRQAEAFINDIKNGNEPIASGADALEDMRLIEEMWRIQMNYENSCIH